MVNVNALTVLINRTKYLLVWVWIRTYLHEIAVVRCEISPWIPWGCHAAWTHRHRRIRENVPEKLFMSWFYWNIDDCMKMFTNTVIASLTVVRQRCDLVAVLIYIVDSSEHILLLLRGFLFLRLRRSLLSLLCYALTGHAFLAFAKFPAILLSISNQK